MRKREYRKIDFENNIIAQRLIARNSSVNIKAIEDDYKKKEYLRNQLRKVKLFLIKKYQYQSFETASYCKKFI